MKNLLLTIITTFSCITAFAHPGHSHEQMSDGILTFHILWIIIPIALGVGFFLLTKKKKETQKK